MFILSPPSNRKRLELGWLWKTREVQGAKHNSIFQYAKKLFLSEQAGRIHLQEFARLNAANALSLTNLVMGLSSILCSLNGHHYYACWFLLFGFLLDLADGAVARQLNACSALGAKLDDFADFTTFGIATSLLLQAQGILNGVFVICYAMAVFARLCFFSSGIPFVYRGLPCLYASAILACTSLLTGGNRFLLYIAAVVMILFMTDQGNYPHDKVLESQIWKKVVYIGGLMALFCCPLRLACIYYLIWCFSYTLFPSTLWSCKC
ncbi:transmembrane protein 269 isoform X1 [Scyliorhinus torazame]|uniref:transmembrane protein 269 isoform X2 n=1 Tax=Scyliorhinus canicula TaxID=7830 RepID=UPI0018F3933E|nr:transmembrane protein 269 isoform X2 [Scyliorhinus canicula]